MAKKKRKFKNRKKRQIKVQNSNVVGASGAGQRQDQGRNTRIGFNHPMNRNTYQQTQEYAQMYYTEWTARKIVDIPVDDMLREGWKYNGLDKDQEKALIVDLRKKSFNKSLRQGLRLERLLGGSALLMGVKDQQDDPSEPLVVENVDKGDLAFVNMIPRTRMHVSQFDNDPFSSGFGHPMIYEIHGKPVHRSRLIVFDGDPLVNNNGSDLSLRKFKNHGFGESVLSAVYDDIIRSVGSRQGAMHLINRASVLLIQNQSMQGQLEGKSGQNALKKLDDMCDQISMYQSAMVDGKKVNLDQFSASFGSVPELLMSFLQVLSAGSDIPATRFLGTAPGGLNATGQADLENYYNMIDAKRDDRLRPQLEKFFRVELRSMFGKDFDAESIELEFPPLWNLSETDLATVRTADTNNSVALVGAGIIDSITAQQELKERGALEVDPNEDPGLDFDLTEDNVDVGAMVDKLIGTE